jgi:hypothetical protein
MTGSKSQPSQGRNNRRPWEAWLFPIKTGSWVIGICGVAAIFLGAKIHHLLQGIIGLGIAVTLELLIMIYRHLVSESMTMWQRLDERITNRDRQWRPRWPKVTRRDRGLVVTVKPVPGLTDENMRKALSEVAQMYGLRLINFEVQHPKGFVRRSVGQEKLRIEMGL